MTSEIEEGEKVVFEALQRAKKAYSERLQKAGLDECCYSLRLIVYETDDEYKPLRKILEMDGREMGRQEEAGK